MQPVGANPCFARISRYISDSVNPLGFSGIIGQTHGLPLQHPLEILEMLRMFASNLYPGFATGHEADLKGPQDDEQEQQA